MSESNLRLNLRADTTPLGDAAGTVREALEESPMTEPAASDLNHAQKQRELADRAKARQIINDPWYWQDDEDGLEEN